MVSPANVFTPTKEIQDTDRFAGRQDQLQALADALEMEGGHIVIYGNRGVGKSSLARQLQLMSQNDPAVIKRLKREPFSPFDFIPVYLQCDDSITGVEELLVRLLTNADALGDWLPFRIVSRERTAEASGTLKLKIVDVGGKGGSKFVEKREEVEADLYGLFATALKEITKAGVAGSGVLIIIDEFDRIKDKAGLASILKSVGSDMVKFALVGVATTPQELIRDHESVARQLTGGCVLVPPMSDQEMQEIFDLAQQALGYRVLFPAETRAWIIKVARGHPYFVHLLGRHSLIASMSAGVDMVTPEMAQHALEEIAIRESAPIQETLYKTAIGHSYPRETILKEFAGEDADEIHTQALYARVAAKLGVDASVVSVYVGQLVNEKYGAVLEKTRERYYRFKDSLFKAYAAARPFQLQPGARESDES
ncbi:AAA family ATPase [Skermanella rosea]|uniref:AAA family ATPase n=1 Tax=Skermanella rosea TaxID=1817965 RepID=UPI001931BEDE|nr:AAA family ATPase [Skermanella rosea]UEM04559.1 AAA family ATPase [Skermanella rosea]